MALGEKQEENIMELFISFISQTVEFMYLALNYVLHF